MISCLREPVPSGCLEAVAHRLRLEQWIGSDHRTFWYATGRCALFQALRVLSFNAGASVLMPAYVPAGVIDPVRALGHEVRFYETGRDLLIAPQSIQDQLKLDRSIRAMVVIHPMGRPQPIAALRAVCQEHNVLIIEDCAQALFCRDEAGKPLGQGGDISLFSLTKTVGVPEGAAAVIVNAALATPAIATVREWSTRMAILWYRAHLRCNLAFHRTSKLSTAMRLQAMSGHCYDRYYRTISRDFRPLRLSRRSARLLRRLRCDEVIQRRRENVSFLYRTVRTSSLEWVFPHDAPGWVPMALPALVTRGARETFVRRALEDGVLLPSLCDRWDFLPNDVGFHHEREYLARHLLVPVNEHIGPEQIAHVAEVLNRL